MSPHSPPRNTCGCLEKFILNFRKMHVAVFEFFKLDKCILQLLQSPPANVPSLSHQDI